MRFRFNRCCSLTAANPVKQSPIKSDESVIFFPTYGTLDEAATVWDTRIHGWIFEPSTLGGLSLAALRISLDLPANAEADEIFRQRARPFGVDNERGKAIPIVFDLDAEPEIVVLEKSTPNGHFHDRVAIPADHIRAADKTSPPYVNLHAVVRQQDTRSFTGSAALIPPRGISVISDIDDTIKDSNVVDRKELLRNTFLRPFSVIPGMADRYQAWQAESSETFAMHYVTASPWQLFQPLQGFLQAEGFPAGTMHMKPFRVKDSTFLDLFRNQVRHKTDAITRILNDFPQRKFVLVGDAGEHDPEIYGDIARQRVGQILAIYIRDFAGLTRESARLQAAFKDIAQDRWHLFSDGDDLPQSLASLQG